jgi:hypothetical protein
MAETASRKRQITHPLEFVPHPLEFVMCGSD